MSWDDPKFRTVVGLVSVMQDCSENTEKATEIRIRLLDALVTVIRI